jgi:hypothetical protein
MIKSIAVAAALVLGSTAASFASDGFIGRWNASLNTPAAKEALLKQKCAAANGVDLFLCDRWRATGVPNSDVRIGLAAAGAVAGMGAGMVAQAVPFAALGGKTALEYVGITTIGGTVITTPIAAGLGAAAGAVVVGGAAALAR